MDGRTKGQTNRRTDGKTDSIGLMTRNSSHVQGNRCNFQENPGSVVVVVVVSGGGSGSSSGNGSSSISEGIGDGENNDTNDDDDNEDGKTNLL